MVHQHVWPSITLVSPAKINLFLHVTGVRDDGYHLLQTAFQFLDYSDQLKFELVEQAGLTRIDDHCYSLPKKDLVLTAADLLRQATDKTNLPGVQITLTKRIPPGSGMGGGSSNAAMTLLGLNHLWQLGLDREHLIDIGRQLGADVPVFVGGQSCWAEGIGDELASFSPPQHWYCVWIPDVDVSTAQIFNHPELNRNHPEISPSNYMQGNHSNGLQPITRKLFPQVDYALKTMQPFGQARMNGSGSSVFVQCQSQRHANEIRSQLPQQQNIHVIRSANTLAELQLDREVAQWI